MLSRVLKWAQIAQALLASLAIVLAGSWFLKQGMYKPRIDVTQTVTDRRFTDKWVWLRVQISVTNHGLMEYQVPQGISRISQLLPTPSLVAKRLSRGEVPRNNHGYVELPVLSEIRISRPASVEPGETISIAVEHFVHTKVESVLVLAEFPSTAFLNSVRSNGVVHDLKHSAKHKPSHAPSGRCWADPCCG